MPVQVFSFYIFDRHTECIYSKLWIAPPPPRPLSTVPAHTSNDLSPSPSTSTALHRQSAPPATTTTTAPASNNNNGISGGAYRDVRSAATRAKDDAKLIFGTVFSLRNMVRKLGGDDDAFISYRTAQYKLHYYETPSCLRFAMLTEPGALSMRNVLHQIYINLWVEYVVKNPLSPVEHKNGEGVKNEMFELGLDKFVRGLM
ncbi:snare-like protein [Apiospora arundinis]|uniref:Trafficking protein particle complex subunit n=1 Tax=Apiospora arundinis TaxID=335852 RepID=A0ABR2J5I3_9PEZI